MKDNKILGKAFHIYGIIYTFLFNSFGLFNNKLHDGYLLVILSPLIFFYWLVLTAILLIWTAFIFPFAAYSLVFELPAGLLNGDKIAE